MNRPWVIAHRGASADAPENTLAAFRRALELGVDWIELDVRFSADQRLAVIHDPRLGRTTNGRGRVNQRTAQELSQLDAGSWFGRRFAGERVPLLEEVFEEVWPTRAGLLIEIKTEPSDPAGAAGLILDLVGGWVRSGRVILQSFDHSLVRSLNDSNPGIPTAALIEHHSPDPVAQTISTGSGIMAIKWRLLRRSLVETCRFRGLRVFSWTVNREGDLRRAVQWGLDGIITNHPDRLLGMLARRGATD